MKYYESSFDEYILSSSKINIHPELANFINALPADISKFKNLILYGPSGVGKYTQALNIIKRYSKCNLKYERKLFINTDKYEKKKEARTEKGKTANIKRLEFVNRISDIHYEVDMAILGCNSKTLWHEIFFKIVDIVSAKQEKVGIILCRNFHHVYNELLEVFYSFLNNPLQQFNVKIYFMLLTEHVGFLPDNIQQCFQMVHVKRPEYDSCMKITNKNDHALIGENSRMISYSQFNKNLQSNLDYFGVDCLTNLKELHGLKRKDKSEIPKDIFNVVVDNIIQKMYKPETIQIQSFRNDIYDILIYDINVSEFICHIIFYIIENNTGSNEDIHDILKETVTFFKYYNNNYRPIYHLENIIFFIINKIHKERYIKFAL
jgi:Cdc6-like AAA superfamily ATPase